MDSLLPFHFILTHAPGRTRGMADYLSRHPLPSNKNNQIEAEELWNHWFAVNKIDLEKIVFYEQNRRGTASQAISRGLSNVREMEKESERTESCENETENTLCKQEQENN